MENGLFHYTSIDTLEKILDNRTFCFTNLGLVDDLDEVETADLRRFGRFCYVSCWTKEEKESIPMWNMYTPGMQGVRIKMRAFPFKKYVIQPGQMANAGALETYIDVLSRDELDLPYILHVYPQLIEIDYTEREELLYPQVKTETTTIENKETIENGQKKVVQTERTNSHYNTKHIGVFKRKCWAFQAEWRYKLIVAPYTYKEITESFKIPNGHVPLVKRMEDDSYILQEERIFLALDDGAVREMEILIGPRATEEQKQKVFALAQKHGIGIANVKTSSLRIR